MEIRELLTFYKFPGDEIPTIRGSPLSALLGKNDELGKNAILKLMDAVYEYITNPVRQLDKPFLMPIEDIFSIQGCGTVVAGGIEQGTIKVGEDIEVLGLMQVAAKTGTIETYKRFEAEIYVLTKDEGGHHTTFFSNYMPQFYMMIADVMGKVELPENVKMAMPGDSVTAAFELISPVPLEAGQGFALRGEGRTVGAKVVSKVVG